MERNTKTWLWWWRDEGLGDFPRSAESKVSVERCVVHRMFLMMCCCCVYMFHHSVFCHYCTVLNTMVRVALSPWPHLIPLFPSLQQERKGKTMTVRASSTIINAQVVC